MNNKIAFITGGTSGIGAEFSRRFAQRGYDLIITGRRKELIMARAEELRNTYKVNVEVIIAELSNEQDLLMLVDVIKKHDNIEVLINNAGFGLLRPYWKDEIINQETMAKVHIMAPIKLMYAVLPQMLKNQKGYIINMSSLASFLPIPRDAMYSATKQWHNSFMQSMHIGLRDKGIKVQVLCPGFTRTDFHQKMGLKHSELQNRFILRWMQPSQVVDYSLRKLNKKNKVIVMPGFWNRFTRRLVGIIPSRLYYTIATKLLS
jgi:uncharacterized protein